eukprot:761649-Hanusia_phi.AAC.2
MERRRKLLEAASSCQSFSDLMQEHVSATLERVACDDAMAGQRQVECFRDPAGDVFCREDQPVAATSKDFAGGDRDK